MEKGWAGLCQQPTSCVSEYSAQPIGFSKIQTFFSNNKLKRYFTHFKILQNDSRHIKGLLLFFLSLKTLTEFYFLISSLMFIQSIFLLLALCILCISFNFVYKFTKAHFLSVRLTYIIYFS